jgi:hypothetical protein
MSQTFTPENIQTIYRSLQANELHTGKLPAGLTKDLYGELWMAKNMAYWGKYSDSNSRKFLTTNISKIIIDEFRKKAFMLKGFKAQDQSPNYIGFSGNHNTLAPFLASLKLSSVHCWLKNYESLLEGKSETADKLTYEPCHDVPGFANNLIFELSQNPDGDYFARILYNGENIALPCDHHKINGYCR